MKHLRKLSYAIAWLLIASGCGGVVPVNDAREACWRDAANAYHERADKCDDLACMAAAKAIYQTEQEACQ